MYDIKPGQPFKTRILIIALCLLLPISIIFMVIDHKNTVSLYNDYIISCHNEVVLKLLSSINFFEKYVDQDIELILQNASPRMNDILEIIESIYIYPGDGSGKKNLYGSPLPNSKINIQLKIVGGLLEIFFDEKALVKDRVRDHLLILDPDDKLILGNPEVLLMIKKIRQNYIFRTKIKEYFTIITVEATLAGGYPGYLINVHSLVYFIMGIFALILIYLWNKNVNKTIEFLANYMGNIMKEDKNYLKKWLNKKNEIGQLANQIYMLQNKMEKVSGAIIDLNFLEMDSDYIAKALKTITKFIKLSQIGLYVYRGETLSLIENLDQQNCTFLKIRDEYESFLRSIDYAVVEKEVQFFAETGCIWTYPLIYKKKIYGFFYIQYEEDGISEVDLNIVEYVRDKFLNTLVNIEMFEKLNEKKEELFVNNIWLEILLLKANELRDLKNLDELYSNVCSTICHTFGFDKAFFLRYNKKEDSFWCQSFFSWEKNKKLKQHLIECKPLNKVLHQVCQKNQVLIYTEAKKIITQFYKNDYLKLIGESYPEEIILLPIYQNSLVAGILALDSTNIKVNKFFLGHLKLYVQVIGQEIERIELLEKLELNVTELNAERLRLKESLEELDRTKEALAVEKFKHYKDDLITELSHDMRSPLTVLAGYLDLLKNYTTFDQDKADEIIAIMQGETNTLIQMIENLLESSKILSVDKNMIIKTNFNLNSWLNDEHFFMSEKRVKKYVAEDLMIVTDQIKLEKILFNLIDNALKYSKDIVKVIAKKINDEIVIIVKDYGIGIDSKNFDFIFKRFYRIKNATTRTIRGSGLGLHIAYVYTQQMGGRLELYSSLDKGSTFVLRLKDATG